MGGGGGTHAEAITGTSEACSENAYRDWHATFCRTL